MRIIFLRHGIAIDREHPDCPDDPDRYLTADGISRTRKAIKGLKRLGIQPRHVLSSPWRRARETAELALQGIESQIQRVMIDDKTYYRVRIGPIDDLDELNVLRSRLRAAKIDALRIRLGE